MILKHKALSALDSRSKEILIDRWLQDQKLTLHELADKYGVSAERIRQIEKTAMEKVACCFIIVSSYTLSHI